MSNTEPDRTHAGRQIVLEPVSPGVWLIIGGATIAVLGPLFGFLAGSMKGVSNNDDLDPIYLFLFGGMVLGGVGVVMLLLGLWRVYARPRSNPARDDS